MPAPPLPKRYAKWCAVQDPDILPRAFNKLTEAWDCAPDPGERSKPFCSWLNNHVVNAREVLYRLKGPDDLVSDVQKAYELERSELWGIFLAAHAVSASSDQWNDLADAYECDIKTIQHAIARASSTLARSRVKLARPECWPGAGYRSEVQDDHQDASAPTHKDLFIEATRSGDEWCVTWRMDALGLAGTLKTRGDATGAVTQDAQIHVKVHPDGVRIQLTAADASPLIHGRARICNGTTMISKRMRPRSSDVCGATDLVVLDAFIPEGRAA